MKALLTTILLAGVFFSHCTNDDDCDSFPEIKRIAWDYLSDQAKSTVTTNWKCSVVTEAVYNETGAYAVSFKTKDDALLGPIVVYVNKQTKEVLGQATRL